nr:CehA/McbA family metallohydrolase [Desulfofundulus thermobenzoicus]
MRGKIAALLAVTLVLGSSMFPLPARAQGGQAPVITMEVDVPPVIRRPVPFPVAVTVMNKGEENQDVVLKEVRLKAAGGQEKLLHRQELNQPLKAVGRELRTLDQEKERAGQGDRSAAPERLEQLAGQVNRGKKAIKITVDPNTLVDHFAPGKKLHLKLEADLLPADSVTPDKANQKAVKVMALTREKTITVAPPLERPPVPPGASHSDWYFGDTHSHSTYTWDYWIGNGIYTIPELKSLAMAAGLDWLNLTDHSYCLDAGKYQEIKNQTTALCDPQFSFLYGEELSVREIKDGTTSDLDTAHYATILNETFVPSVTNIFRQAYSPNSQEGIDRTKNSGGLVVINHPQWGDRPLEPWNFNLKTYPWTHGENAIELINGPWDDPDLGAVTRWIEQRLLKGEKVAAVGASDTESQNRLGTAMTVTYAGNNTRQDIKTSLAGGKQYATTGPGLALWARPEGDFTWHWMGETVTAGTGRQVEIYVAKAWSTGSLDIKVMKGRAGAPSEETVDTRTLPAGSDSYTITVTVDPGTYIRAWAVDPANSGARAYTTPVWFN